MYKYTMMHFLMVLTTEQTRVTFYLCFVWTFCFHGALKFNL